MPPYEPGRVGPEDDYSCKTETIVGDDRERLLRDTIVRTKKPSYEPGRVGPEDDYCCKFRLSNVCKVCV